jgi:hypothetical protein
MAMDISRASALPLVAADCSARMPAAPAVSTATAIITSMSV